MNDRDVLLRGAGWLVSALDRDHPDWLADEIGRARAGGCHDIAAGIEDLRTILDQSSDRQPRERAVMCRHIGCTAMTFNWQALCGRHLESDETATTPRRLEAVDPPTPTGGLDDSAPAGTSPAGRGHPLTA